MERAERLSAYLDKSLEPSAMLAVEVELVRDPALAAQLERLREHDALLRQAFDAPTHEAVPDHLLAMLTTPAAKPEAQIFNLATEREKLAGRSPAPTQNRWRYAMALAATLVLGLFVGSWMQPGTSGDPLTTSTAFNQTLDATPSAQTVALDAATKLTPVMSFARGDGQLCRQFTLDAPSHHQAGISCRNANGWSVEALVPHAPTSGSGGYQTAGGAEDDGLGAVFATLKAGDPLDAAAEQAMIRKGWKAR